MKRNCLMQLRYREHMIQLSFVTEDEDIESQLAAVIDRQDSLTLSSYGSRVKVTDSSFVPGKYEVDYFTVDATKLLYATVTYNPPLY
jgi:hypothetical protein